VEIKEEKPSLKHCKKEGHDELLEIASREETKVVQRKEREPNSCKSNMTDKLGIGFG